MLVGKITKLLSNSRLGLQFKLKRQRRQSETPGGHRKYARGKSKYAIMRHHKVPLRHGEMQRDTKEFYPLKKVRDENLGRGDN